MIGRPVIVAARGLVIAACCSLALPAASASAGPSATQKQVEESLTCQCGCGLTVHTCNHLQCGFGVPVKEDVAASLAAGQSAEEILARYVDEYGEKILSSPVPRGFNLVAWFGPYVAVLLGGVGIVIVVRRWRTAPSSWEPGSRHPDAPAGTQPAEATASDEDRERLRRELEGFDA